MLTLALVLPLLAGIGLIATGVERESAAMIAIGLLLAVLGGVALAWTLGALAS